MKREDLSMTTDSSDTSDIQKAQVQAYFSRTAANYVTSVSHRTGSDLQRVIELGEWDTSLHAIDIATGGGHTALAVAPHVAQITVTDLTPAMLEQAKAFLIEQGVTNAQYSLADAEQLPFDDNSFDRATCRIAPHHFPNVSQAVNEIARVLKPHGLFLLIDSCAPSDPELDTFVNGIEKWRDNSHIRSYTQEQWQAFFRIANMEIEHAETFRRTHNYRDWTARSQLSSLETSQLKAHILSRSQSLQEYFGVVKDDTGDLITFSTDFILLKGRKK
jgi:ubiquinone/menaquinone biosynthesis C-methylase UbiE